MFFLYLFKEHCRCSGYVAHVFYVLSLKNMAVHDKFNNKDIQMFDILIIKQTHAD